MSFSQSMDSPKTLTARQRREQDEAETARRRNRQVGSMFGLSFIDVVWSNDTRRAYHPICRDAIPEGPLGTIDMAADPLRPDMWACGACGLPLTEVE